MSTLDDLLGKKQSRNLQIKEEDRRRRQDAILRGQLRQLFTEAAQFDGCRLELQLGHAPTDQEVDRHWAATFLKLGQALVDAGWDKRLGELESGPDVDLAITIELLKLACAGQGEELARRLSQLAGQRLILGAEDHEIQTETDLLRLFVEKGVEVRHVQVRDCLRRLCDELLGGEPKSSPFSRHIRPESHVIPTLPTAPVTPAPGIAGPAEVSQPEKGTQSADAVEEIATPAKSPQDGPVPPDGFRLSGRLCDGLSVYEYRLLESLWGKEARLLQDVIDHVYGHDADNKDQAVMSLVKRVRNKLLQAQIPAEITSKSGYLVLKSI